MYHPFCKRCHTGNNQGDNICGNCMFTLDFAKRFNTAFDRFDGNRERLYEYFGFSQRQHFFDLIASIPEITKACHDIKPKEPEKLRKFINSKGEIRNKLSLFQVRMCNTLLKDYEYYNLSEEKQKEFMDWVLSHSADKITIAKAREKLLEYNSNQEVIQI